jgi:hypothetical protein
MSSMSAIGLVAISLVMYFTISRGYDIPEEHTFVSARVQTGQRTALSGHHDLHTAPMTHCGGSDEINL